MPIVVILTRFNAPASSLGDHRHGLLLCWKLRTGLQKNVDPARMMAYCQRFHTQHLVPHFGLGEVATDKELDRIDLIHSALDPAETGDREEDAFWA